jgi:hypothetical protein
MAHVALDRHGDTVRNPSVRQLRQLLASLTPAGDGECVTLVRDGQWSLSASYAGLVCLENPHSGEGPWHMAGLSVTRILELWELLAAGSIEELKALPWQDGAGA